MIGDFPNFISMHTILFFSSSNTSYRPHAVDSFMQEHYQLGLKFSIE